MTIEQIENLLKLKKENLELEIVYMVDYEVCGNDDFRYWQAEVERIEKGIYVLVDEKIYTDMEYFEEYLIDCFWDTNKSDKENNEIIEKEKSKYEIKEAIFIYLGV